METPSSISSPFACDPWAFSIGANWMVLFGSFDKIYKPLRHIIPKGAISMQNAFS
jgi:hypothetical protein